MLSWAAWPYPQAGASRNRRGKMQSWDHRRAGVDKNRLSHLQAEADYQPTRRRLRICEYYLQATMGPSAYIG